MIKLSANVLKLTVLILFLLLSNKTLASGSPEHITLIVSEPLFPYFYTTGKKYVGIDIELINKITQKLDLNIEILSIPRARVKKILQQGHADGILTTLPFSQNSLPEMWFSAPLYKTNTALVTKKKKKLNIDSFKSNPSLIIGSVRGFTDKFKMNNHIYVSTNRSLFKMLQRDRVEGVIVEELSFFKEIRQNSDVRYFRSKIIEARNTKMGILHSSPHFPDIKEKFNDKITEVIQQEYVEQLYSKYLQLKE